MKLKALPALAQSELLAARSWSTGQHRADANARNQTSDCQRGNPDAQFPQNRPFLIRCVVFRDVEHNSPPSQTFGMPAGASPTMSRAMGVKP